MEYNTIQLISDTPWGEIHVTAVRPTETTSDLSSGSHCEWECATARVAIVRVAEGSSEGIGGGYAKSQLILA